MVKKLLITPSSMPSSLSKSSSPTTPTTPTTTLTRVRFDLANFPVSETIKMLTCLLEKIIKANDSLIQQHDSTTTSNLYSCFQSRTKPSIDIQSYLSRILKYCPCANECFLSLLVYFDRMTLQQKNSFKRLRIDSYNIHRLIISGIMVASKFFSDIYFTNARYAKVGGLPVKELNILELEFLAINNYNIYISLEELQQYGDQLLMHSIRENEKRSSFLNYTPSTEQQQQQQKKQQPIIKYKNNNDLFYSAPWDK